MYLRAVLCGLLTCNRVFLQAMEKLGSIVLQSWQTVLLRFGFGKP